MDPDTPDTIAATPDERDAARADRALVAHVDLGPPGGRPRPLDMYESRPRPAGRRRAEPYRGGDDGGNGLWIALGAGALLGAAGMAYVARQRTVESRRRRPPDSAPKRTLKHPPPREDGRSVTGRTVTIAKPRAEVYAFWHDHTNLPRVIENVRSVEREADGTYRWTVQTLGDRTLEMRTRNTVERENEEIRWVSAEGSSIDTEGRVAFRDAPANRGTEVTLVMRYRLPGGELGRLAATALGRSPGVQARRSAKRLKMLLETGEIATGDRRRGDAA